MTTVPAMIVAERGTARVVASRRRRWSAGSFAAGSANTINCYVDRDIDVRMHRTRSGDRCRTSVVTPQEALRFGVILGVLATLWLGLLVNLAVRRARAGRDRLLRLRLHARHEAFDALEHRHRRRRGLHAGAHRLVRRDGAGRAARRS